MPNTRQCTRCVMDTSASNIEFDVYGICNFCTNYLARYPLGKRTSDDLSNQVRLESLVSSVKAKGKNKPYDCIVGVSGGVDSAWALVQAKQLGLRPLAVHMDNGWNSELAQYNIETLVNKLGVDLYTYVIDWNEYRELMQAFFDADVIDIELLYDNAMLAVNFNMARRYGLKYILSGSNHATEGIDMPKGWNWNKLDKKNIESIARQNNIHSFSTFPAIGYKRYLLYTRLGITEWIPFLDYLSYDKASAVSELQLSYGYKPYPYKHYESIFTRFYQGYILPKKFKVDKRKLHLSSLVVTNQCTRSQALQLLENIPYDSESSLSHDIDYFLKKMNWTTAELDDYLRRPPVPHDHYRSEVAAIQGLSIIYSKLFKKS